jgi:hypothetical protein
MSLRPFWATQQNTVSKNKKDSSERQTDIKRRKTANSINATVPFEGKENVMKQKSKGN